MTTRRLMVVVALVLAPSGCSSSSGAVTSDAGASSEGSASYGCSAQGLDNCFCSNGFPATKGTCNTHSVVSAAGLGGASCCKFNDAQGSCSCWAFVCDNYAAGLSTTDCGCGWFGSVNPQTSCTGTYCCAIPAHGAGASAESGECHCGDTACAAGQTQVAQCDLTTTPPDCPPRSASVMACD